MENGMNARIVATGSYVPEGIVTNDDLAKIVDTNDEWIRSRTGIEKRRISRGESAADLAVKAGEQAITAAGITVEEIDMIVVGTLAQSLPNVACTVQAKLGADNAVAMDLSAACSGFMFALNTVNAYVRAGMCKTALVIGTEVLSRYMDWSDRGTCVLFGDGAGAVVIQADEIGIIDAIMGSDGKKGEVLTYHERELKNLFIEEKVPTSYIQMNGQEVFRFAVTKVPECITELLKKTNTSAADVKYFILHQANKRILDSVAKRLKLDIEKFPMNLNHYGNTSAASIPLLLDEINREGKLKKGDKIVLSGFGGGLTWGALLLEW